MSPSGRRVLVIGLDGATFRLLDPWVAAGDLPEIARLMASGCHGELRSTFPPLTPPAWSSFMTGKNPGKHGVFAFRHPATNGYESGALVTARSLRARTLWQIVGEAGLPVGAINVPPSYPVRPVNGFIVSCMFTPPGEQAVIYPPELREVLGDDYETAVTPPRQLRPSEPAYAERCLAYLQRLRRAAERRLAITCRLMSERPWNLLSVVFYEPDRVQHFFWSHLTGTGPAGLEPGCLGRLVHEARAVYRAVDDAVGAIVRAAGPQTVTMIVSDHGFNAAPRKFVYVNRWLADSGWLRPHGAWRSRRWLVRRLPRRLRSRYKTVGNILVDFARSSAWCEVLDARSAGVWLNLRGRQPLGRIASGEEYDTARARLIQALRGLRDGDHRVFEMVEPREAVYSGPATLLAPDVLLHAAPDYGFTFSMRAEVSARTPFVPFDWNGYTGTHEPGGIYVAAGPGISSKGRVGSAPIEAIAPTILALLDLPIPDDMDAPPLLDLLTAEKLASTSVSYVAEEASGAAVEDDGWLSTQDRSRVEERLRALGYLE